MPLSERWYFHDKDCVCSECRYHKTSTPTQLTQTPQPHIKYYCPTCKSAFRGLVDFIKGIPYCQDSGDKLRRYK